jgi:hypothetical protein
MSKSKGEEIGVDKLEWDKQHLLQGRSELRAGSGGGGSLNIPVESIPGFFNWLVHIWADERGAAAVPLRVCIRCTTVQQNFLQICPRVFVVQLD